MKFRGLESFVRVSEGGVLLVGVSKTGENEFNAFKGGLQTTH